ncbi:MAG: CAP domain-containing protein, partial [Chloroflexota bacterium]
MKRVTTQLLCAALAGGMALWHFTPMNPVPSVLAAGCTVHTTLSSDIAPITSFDTVSNIEANFNHARQTEGCSTLLSLPSAYGGMSGEQQMYTLFNAERTDRGLGSLRLDPSLLTQIDVNHSHEMEQYNYFNHPSPINHPGASHVFDRLTANPAIAGHWSALGENIAAGFNPASAVYSYMYQDASENWGHRVNILNSAFTWVGVGEYTGGYYGTYFTSDFLGGAYTAPAAADTQAPALSVPTVVSGSLASGGTVRVQVSGVQDAGAVSGEAGITGVVFYANSVTQDGSGNADTVAATQGPSGTWTASLNVSPQAVIHAVAVDGSGNYTDCFVGAAGCAGVNTNPTPSPSPTPSPTPSPAPSGSVSVSLNPAAGAPGTPVAASGSGYASREIVYLYLDQTTRAFAGVYAATSGSFSRSFNIPSTSSGTHRIYAIGRSSGRSASTTLVVTVQVNRGS